MRLNLCIDIDGTITEPYYWLKLANQYFGTNVSPSGITCYEIHKVLNIQIEEYLNFYNQLGERLHLEAEVRQDAGIILKRLEEQHNLHYVTARESKMTHVTKEWIKMHDLPKVGLHILGSHYKVKKAEELECDIFIEDRYENALELALAGFKVLLIDCNYNRSPLIYGITRVYSWIDIYEEITAYVAREKSKKIA
ncbi:hypothetical protein E9840_08885 [Tissierella creatinini]|nr:hypothetical protein E9840_08885 [Tissierella creatinini]TJX62549.1 hypothetical protein E8P77_16845 [Soehngenia saccharolytica]